MHNTHRTLVPIGAHYQAILPSILPPEVYRLKTVNMMKSLKILKVNDPEEGEGFYRTHF